MQSSGDFRGKTSLPPTTGRYGAASDCCTKLTLDSKHIHTNHAYEPPSTSLVTSLIPTQQRRARCFQRQCCRPPPVNSLHGPTPSPQTPPPHEPSRAGPFVAPLHGRPSRPWRCAGPPGVGVSLGPRRVSLEGFASTQSVSSPLLQRTVRAWGVGRLEVRGVDARSMALNCKSLTESL